jgi:hypothetical protein
MAITTLDDIIAGVKPAQFFAKSASNTTAAGRTYSFWGTAGIPGAGTYDSVASGTVLSSSAGLLAGQIPYYNATPGKQMHLVRAVGLGNNSGIMLICDRLWQGGGISLTSTSPQTINSVTWPTRDANGTSNGEGVLIGLEIVSSTSTNSPTLTLNYTNSEGVTNRTGVNQLATSSTVLAGHFYTFTLQAGDKGVQSIQSLTLSTTWTSGGANLVAYRILAVLEQPSSNLGVAVDALTGGLPKLYDGTVPYIMYVSAGSSAFRVYGQLIYAEG